MASPLRPKLLLADEPTTALDDAAARPDPRSVCPTCGAQTRASTVPSLITHDLALVRRFADRVAVMEQGAAGGSRARWRKCCCPPR